MLCRHCDTEIEDQALICFKCGTATLDSVHRPFDVTPRRPVARFLLLGGGFLFVAGFFLMLAADGVPVSPVVWVMLATAAALLAWRLALLR